MKRSDIVSQEEINKLVFLKGECDRLNNELRKVTPDTDKETIASIEKSIQHVTMERDRLMETISEKNAKVFRFVERLNKKIDGTDLEAFDQDLKDFFETMADYYLSQVEKYQEMLTQLYDATDLSFRNRLRRFITSFRIRREIRRCKKNMDIWLL